jgi:chromodomain-helicase-DNA-binding protein 1
MATPTQGDVSNGHVSPEPQTETRTDDGLSLERVDSAQALPTRNPSPSPSETQDLSNDPVNGHDVAASSSSSPNDASEDADFDMDESQVSQQDEDMADGQESSGSSPPATKRKNTVAEDEYMRMDPELYGLRRSVRHKSLNIPRRTMTNLPTDETAGVT